MSNKEDMYNYDTLDDFIANNNTQGFHMSSISSYILKQGKNIYNEMKISQNMNKIYIIFGYTGYISYGLYKSKEEIYLLVFNSHTQTFKDYIKMSIENERLFDL
jgi:hypothetical protein